MLDHFSVISIQKKYTEQCNQVDVICRHFGCGKTLSLHEQLCGKYCIQHSITGLSVGKKKADKLEDVLNKIFSKIV